MCHVQQYSNWLEITILVIVNCWICALLTIMRAVRNNAAHNGDVMAWRSGYGQVCRLTENTLIGHWLYSDQVTTVEPQVVDHKVIFLQP